jgi:alpha-D-ribose 1-methylphosphonate 5-triphosphate synthase subunit PhnH
MSIARTTGYADPVHDSQSTFRAIMRAMARPGSVERVIPDFAPPASLAPAAAAVCLTLADFETPLWLSPSLAADGEAGAYLRFHTGAPSSTPSGAAFALVHPRDGVDLGDLAQGTAEYPDRSTTLILLCDGLDTAGPLTLAGPGIRGTRRFGFAPMPDDFLQQWARNRSGFPLGVDIILAAGDRIACLPRTTRILSHVSGEVG